MSAADDTKLTMSAAELARTLVRHRARDRARIATQLDSRADTLASSGELMAAQWFREAAEDVREGAGAGVVVPAGEPPEGITAPDLEPEPELPPHRDRDDFSEGVALVQGGAHRRTLTGYEGRTGHLRD